MSLILSGKYDNKKNGLWLFFSNRVLRIYPSYLFIFFFTMLVYFIWMMSDGTTTFMHLYYAGKMSILSQLFIICTNLFVFGQDIVYFLSLHEHTGNFYFTTNFFNAAPQLWKMLLLPQGWTLSLELYFYLLAPFIVKRKTIVLFLLLAVSLAIRWYLTFYRFPSDPWLLRFFPVEIFFFFLGCLSYRIYEFTSQKSMHKLFIFMLSLFMVLLTVFFFFIPQVSLLGVNINPWVYFLGIALLIPLLFRITKNNSIDRYIGRLSYPMYVSQILIINIFFYYFAGFKNNYFFGIVCIIVTLICSVLIVEYIEKPIDRFRQARLRIKR